MTGVEGARGGARGRARGHDEEARGFEKGGAGGVCEGVESV